MAAPQPRLDATDKQLGKLIDRHVLEEREQIFLQGDHVAPDLVL